MNQLSIIKIQGTSPPHAIHHKAHRGKGNDVLVAWGAMPARMARRCFEHHTMPNIVIAQHKLAASELQSGHTVGKLYGRRRCTCGRRRTPERTEVVAGAPAVTLVSKVQARKDCAEAGEGTKEVSKEYQKKGMWRESLVRAQHHLEFISPFSNLEMKLHLTSL